MDKSSDFFKGGKRLLLGNEAIARGALEAGAGFVSCYPGTPSSEVVDSLYARRALMESEGIEPPFRVEYSVNEKVAMEVACGAALGGLRSLVAMKHVGLNVAADPLFTAAYIGMPGGLVVLSADDPGCHSSQNEQDNRQYARFAGLPCFEPSSPAEAHAMILAAFDLASSLGQPVMLRTTTRVSHSRGPVQTKNLPREIPRLEFERQAGRFVPVPAVALKRHRALSEALKEAREIAENSPFNVISGSRNKISPNDPRRGIIASGIARDYLADALLSRGLRDVIPVLELGISWPLPQNKIVEFLRGCDEALVLEEGPALLENDVRALAQEAGLSLKIAGKDAELGEFGEYSTKLVEERLERWLGMAAPKKACENGRRLPGRPPNLCPGCSHRSVYYAARKVFGDGAIYASDIGCYTLGLLPPLKTADFLVCMGSSVSAGSGFASASGTPVVGFIGDSTFFHSGMTGLANAVFNKHDLLLVILDNGTTAMTGHQPNPGMGQESLGDGARRLEMENIVRALGVEHCEVVRASNLKALVDAMERLGAEKGVRVLIARETCLLHARHALKKKKTRVARVKAATPEAEACFRELACPAFIRRNGQLAVDENLCGGCMFCLQIAPKAFESKKFGQ